MPAMPVTLTGVIADLYGRTIYGPVKFLGSLVRTDVTVGGGPIFPEPPNGGEKPPDLGLHPEHPIVLPPPPPEFPNPPDAVKPPPPSGGWGYHSDYGWGYFPMGGPLPGPK